MEFSRNYFTIQSMELLSLLQGIFPIQGSKPGLPHCRQILYQLSYQGSPDQFSSVAQLCLTLCNPMNDSTPGLSVHHQFLESTQTHVHQVGDAIQPSHPLSSPSPPALNLSQHQVFSNKSALRIRWPKYWSFSFNISLPMNTQDWSPLRWTGWISLQSKGLKSLLQHHSSKASILRCSAFFIVQLSHPYMTTGKSIALTRWTLLAK